MIQTPRRYVLIALLCSAALVPLVAQDRRWADLYRQGRDAVRSGRNEDGIRLLEQAVKIEPQQQRERFVGPNDKTEYFPYYYLGLAYLRTKNFERSAEAFRTSRACKCLPGDLAKLQDNWETQLAKERATVAPVDPGLTARLNDLDAAMQAGRFNEALSILEAIRSTNPAEYTKRGLDKRRAEAERGLASRLVQEGQQLMGAGELVAAARRFQDAEARSPGTGQPGLTEVRQRQTTAYSRHRQSAEQEFAAGRIEAALEQLKQAEAIYPEQYASDAMAARAEEWRRAMQKNLAAEKSRVLLDRARAAAAANRYTEAAGLYKTVLSTEENAEAKEWLDAHTRFVALRDRARAQHKNGQLELARQALDDARRQDEARFKFEGLEELLASIDEKLGAMPEEHAAPLRAAVVAILRGEASRAREVLEPIAANGEALDPRVRAHALAFLGVAYADLSLASRDEAERSSLRSKAVEQFRALLALQPEYQLRESLISPRVREIFDEVRIKR
jgi:tetratricopeptide (TPR) repeat protein